MLPLLSIIQMVLVLCIFTVTVVFTSAVISFEVEQKSCFVFVLGKTTNTTDVSR